MPTVINQETTSAVMSTADQICHEPGNPGMTSPTNSAMTTPAKGHHHHGTQSLSWNSAGAGVGSSWPAGPGQLVVVHVFHRPRMAPPRSLR